MKTDALYLGSREREREKERERNREGEREGQRETESKIVRIRSVKAVIKAKHVNEL